MKFAEINKRYTEIVAECISRGCTINAGTMSGSQGEIAHIDLTDGESIIRVLIEEVHQWRTTGDFIQIIVGKCTDKRVKINSNDTWQTIWNIELDVVYCEMFYELGEDRKSGMEYGTKEEAEIVNSKHIQRYSNRPKERDDLTEKYLEIGKRIVKRVWNKKKISNSDVKVYKQNNDYYVSYKYDAYKLH